MFARILVPLDGSETAAAALPVAHEVAHSFHGRLVLVEVISQLLDWHHNLRAPTDSAGTADLEERAVHAARTRLERVALSLRGVPVDIDVRLGRPAEAIFQAVADYGCTLICLAAQGPGSSRLAGTATDRHHPIHWTLGGVSDRIVHASPVPVLLVRAEQRSQAEPAAVFAGTRHG